MKGRGITMIEMLVVIFIISITLVMTVSVYSYFQDTQIKVVSEAVRAAISQAKNISTTRQIPVTACIRNSDGTNCDSFETNWQAGVLVFIDEGTKGTVDGGDEILWLTEPFDSGLAITSSSFSNDYSIQFDSEGKSLSSGTVSICDDRTGETGKLLTVDGRSVSSADQVCS